MPVDPRRAPLSLIILFIGILITILFLARRFNLHTWPWTGI